MILFIAGEIVFIGLVVFTICIGGGSIESMMDFIDYPSLLVVLVGSFGITMVSFSFEEMGTAFSHAFGSEDPNDNLAKSAYFWLAVVRNLLVVGALGTLIGLIQILENLSDPSALGPSMAVALITLFYGILFSAILPLPAFYTIQRRLANRPE